MNAFLRRFFLCFLFDQHRNNHAINHRLRPLFPIRCDVCGDLFYADYHGRAPDTEKADQ